MQLYGLLPVSRQTTTSMKVRLPWPLPYIPCHSQRLHPCRSTGQCDESERHPGLWEFPMWNVQDKTGMTVASMDPMVRACGTRMWCSILSALQSTCA